MMREIAQEESFHLFEMGEGGNGAQVIVEYNTVLPQARQGFGTVHHTAFRVENRYELDAWQQRLHSFQLPNSGYVDRYYFGSFVFKSCTFVFCLNWQRMVLDSWEMSHMKHLVKNYLYRHSLKQNVKKSKALYDQLIPCEVQRTLKKNTCKEVNFNKWDF